MKNVIVFICILFPVVAVAQLQALTVEPNHSTIGFEINIAGYSIVTGKFTSYSIDLDWDENNLDESHISASIDAKSINTGIPDRDKHLQSKDFFDVRQYPLITFRSDKIEKSEDGFIARGTFSMHGVSKELMLPFEITKVDGHTVGFTSRTSIHRQDFGVGSSFQHTSMPDFLSDTIQVRIDFWTKKRKDKK